MHPYSGPTTPIQPPWPGLEPWKYPQPSSQSLQWHKRRQDEGKPRRPGRDPSRGFYCWPGADVAWGLFKSAAARSAEGLMMCAVCKSAVSSSSIRPSSSVCAVFCRIMPMRLDVDSGDW
mmetsp:Transcript_29977/g.85922  ORF Transcript_29977/g.85922 Transcript_29977/m.85922 type:complete len:119 (+) Transcript_29977:83-439(+)